MVLLVLQLWLQLEHCSDWMQRKHLIKGFLCKELLFHLLPTKNGKQIQTCLILFFARKASKSNTNLFMWGSSLVHPSQPSIRLRGAQLRDSAPCQTQEPWCCIRKVEAGKTCAPFPPVVSSSNHYQNKTPGLLPPVQRGPRPSHPLPRGCSVWGWRATCNGAILHWGIPAPQELRFAANTGGRFLELLCGPACLSITRIPNTPSDTCMQLQAREANSESRQKSPTPSLYPEKNHSCMPRPRQLVNSRDSLSTSSSELRTAEAIHALLATSSNASMQLLQLWNTYWQGI